MTTIKIFAEQLQQWDKIIIPASTQTDQKELRVVTVPELNELMVNAFCYRVKDGVTIEQKTPIQFGRKVDLMVEREE